MFVGSVHSKCDIISAFADTQETRASAARPIAGEEHNGSMRVAAPHLCSPICRRAAQKSKNRTLQWVFGNCHDHVAESAETTRNVCMSPASSLIEHTRHDVADLHDCSPFGFDSTRPQPFVSAGIAGRRIASVRIASCVSMALYLPEFREVLLSSARPVENSDDDHKGFPGGTWGYPSN
jgi:hypothetical protein